MNTRITNASTKQEILEYVTSQFEKNDLWEQRALSMLTPVIDAMTWLRDEDLIDISAKEINEFMKLQRVIYLSDETRFPDLPIEIRESVSRYLETLPGYDRESGYNQAQTTVEHHGYLEMQMAHLLKAA